MERRLRMAGFAAGMLLCLAGGAQAQQNPTAQADLKDADGKPVGTIILIQHPKGVLIRAELSGLPPGWHAIHVHETGKCEPPEFKSAGGHFNPQDHKHGPVEAGMHAGDLPNLHAGADGKIMAEMLTDAIRLGERPGASAGGSAAAAATVPAAAADIFDQDGAAMVLHAGPDDYHTDPAGDSGGRIACGVIERGSR